MSILGNLIIVIGNVLDIALTIYSFIVIASALISWVNPVTFDLFYSEIFNSEPY